MKHFRIVAIASSVAVLAVVAACGDIFHSTDSPSLCDLDAAAPGCKATADAAPNGELCAADHASAQKRAAHACAWLAACEAPYGKNATGPCMFEAIQAYDCVANPSRRPKLAAKAFWTAMANVKSCADVDRAVFPDPTSNCSAGPFIGCSKIVTTNNPNTRIVCTTAGQRYTGENCAMQGRSCDATPLNDAGLGNNGAQCYGTTGRTCTTTGCDGAHLVLCDDAGADRGLDCAQFGAGVCTVSGSQPACKPEGTTQIPASSDVVCTPGGKAQATASGYLEEVDCTYLSGGGISGTDNCQKIPNAPPGTPAAAACKKTSGCSVDGCTGNKLTACVGGASVTVDCAAEGLGTCADVTTQEGPRVACTKP